MTEDKVTEAVERFCAALMRDGSDLGECVADVSQALASSGLTLAKEQTDDRG